MTEGLSSLLQQAAALLRSFPTSTRVRVVSHYDADGTAAASILCRTLQRAGYPYHATLMRNPFTKGFDRLRQEKNDLCIFADMGSGQLPDLESLPGASIILDHHQAGSAVPSQRILQVNSNQCGVDGNYEACGSTLAYGFAVAVDPGNVDLSALAVAGAIGDKQHMGGFRGWNADVVNVALSKGVVHTAPGMKLSGATIADAVYYTVDPYFEGISGNKDKVASVLATLSIDHTTPPAALSEPEATRLYSFLTLALLRHGCATEVVDAAISPRFLCSPYGDLEHVADLLDACGKTGHRGIGLSLGLGKTKLLAEAETVERAYKDNLLAGLKEMKKTFVELAGMRYFISTDSSLGGVVAGIAAAFVLDDAKPLFSLTRTDDELHVSCRGTRTLVDRGLDLGAAMRQCAESLHGHGGGHKIAAGATVANTQEAAFLSCANELLQQQVTR